MPHLVDYFVVCGLHSGILDKDSLAGLSAYTSPLCRSYSCKVLAHYPQKQLPWNPFDESAIRTLCMPEGLIFKKNLENPNQTHFHSFLITRENGSQAFASVLTFYEQVTDLAMLSTLDALQRSFLQTRMVTLNSADNESTFDPDMDKLYAPKCLCFVTCKPVVRPCQAYLEQLHAVTAGGKQASGGLPVESFLYNILYEVPLPAPGKTTKFTGPLGQFSWSRPSKNDLPLCDYSFREFFQLLGIRNVFKLLTCILLEHQILLKSADYERLMLCSNCATALLFPFTWQHVFVPILPTSQRAFLDAPVPYIMGLRVDPNSVDAKYLNLPNVASLCTVDIDCGKVEFPDELPSLPNEDRLLVQVSEKLHQHEVSCLDMVDLPHSPDSSNLTPQKPSIIEAIRIMNELPENMRGSDLKKLLNESSNPHLPNLLNIAKRVGRKTALSPTLSLDEGAYDLEEEGDEASEQTPVKGEHDFLPEPQETSFATAVREVFASYFVEHFANYENFIIMPKQSYDQWKKNREQFQNFDKTAFLSDQPINYRAFYAAFVESSLFTLFIDQKIVTIWEPEKADHSLRLFDARVEQYRDKSGLAKLPTTPGPKSADSDRGEESFFDLSGEVINEMAPQPHLVAGSGTTSLTATATATSSNTNSNRGTGGAFPQLDSNLLQVRSSDLEKVPQPSPEMTGQRRAVDHFGLRGSGCDTKLAASPGTVHRLRSSRSSGSSGFGFSSHSHAKFVSQLMRESRLRVKHMLGTTGESANTIEENTHIAYLCDLLERIWGHGLKKRESKSPLWAHLMAYAESEGKEEFQSRKAAAVSQGLAETSPDRMRRPHFSSSLSSIALASTASPNIPGDESPRSSQNLKAHFRRRKFQSPQLRSRLESILQPPPSSLIQDLLTVHNMHELKTDVGRSRAWVRLALEKKALSRHLSKLLSHNELLSRRYREYAFVRTEEEREQFLYHLLTLTARDFSCFTTGFHGGTMNYRVLVVGEGKHFGLSTACLYVTLAGEYGMTDTLEMPRGEYQTETTCHNLGPLTCVRIGHDNSGLTPSLFVEMVLVHNTTTGQIYKFSCGRWFARSEDDGSVERLLVAERVPQTIAKSGTMSALNVDSILPSSPSRRRASTRREHEEKTDMDVKLELKTVMDKIRTLSMGKNKETIQEMLQLIHGPKGFVNCMDQVFQTGFRSSRKFQKKLFIWDLLERVQEQLLASETAQPMAVEVGVVRSISGTERGSSTSPDPEMHCQQMFLNAVSRINSNNPNVGKDEKAMRFFCLGLRDDLLSGWVMLVSQSPVTQSLYETCSFLRDPELLQNLVDALQLTQSVAIRLEPLFIQGL